MQEGQLLMTQADRDRLVTLKKAKKKLITQRAAAEELGLSPRQVKRLLYALKKRGDQAVIHGLRGKPSNRRIEEAIEREAVKILSADVSRGFGSTLAAEYLRKKHGIEASKETVRQWIDRKSTRLNSSHLVISYAVFCLKKKKQIHSTKHIDKAAAECTATTDASRV